MAVWDIKRYKWNIRSGRVCILKVSKLWYLIQRCWAQNVIGMCFILDRYICAISSWFLPFYRTQFWQDDSQLSAFFFTFSIWFTRRSFSKSQSSCIIQDKFWKQFKTYLILIKFWFCDLQLKVLQLFCFPQLANCWPATLVLCIWTMKRPC